jgi:hypothetical protein
VVTAREVSSVSRAKTTSASLNEPIIAIIGFNLLTVAFMMTAPVAWDAKNLPSIYVLVLTCQLLILIGFLLGRTRGFLTRPRTALPLSSGAAVMPYLLGIYLLSFPISYGYRMGFSPFDLSGMASLILAGLQDRVFGYANALRGVGLGPIPWTLYFLVSIFTQCFFIAGFLYWRSMSFGTKLLFGALVCLELLFSLGRGTTFGVVSMVTTFFLAAMFWKRSRLATVLLVAGLFAGSVAVFSYNLYGRSGNVERTVELTGFGRSALILDHPTLAVIPEALQPTYYNVLWYFCGGYYHASFALDLDFKPTLFVGNNQSLIGLAAIFGIDVWNDTYVHRLQTTRGIDELGVWHSAYTWYANDVSFVGVPVVLFSIAYLFGFSWARSAQGDFLSRVVFVILGNMLLFLFANNTYLSSVFYSFMFLLPFWLFTRPLGGVVRIGRLKRRPRAATRSGSGPVIMEPGEPGPEPTR